MSKFDAAIALLQHIEGWPDRNVIAANYIQITPKIGGDREEIKAAIRLLEAAGKIPIYQDGPKDEGGRPFVCTKDGAWDDLAQAILAALPDED